MESNGENRIINEEAAINEAFQELLDIYLASQHRKKVELITKAFNFARQAHKGVRRHSGEAYIMHPLAVARIVCKEIGLGSTSICAALLHDVVEDTDYTVEDSILGFLDFACNFIQNFIDATIFFPTPSFTTASSSLKLLPPSTNS